MILEFYFFAESSLDDILTQTYCMCMLACGCYCVVIQFQFLGVSIHFCLPCHKKLHGNIKLICENKLTHIDIATPNTAQPEGWLNKNGGRPCEK